MTHKYETDRMYTMKERKKRDETRYKLKNFKFQTKRGHDM